MSLHSGGTDHGGAELSQAARDLAARCENQVNELARRMSGDVFESLRGYAELPNDVKDVEIAATARHAMRVFLGRVADNPGRAAALDGSVTLFQERAAQRAEEGMPLQLLLRTYLRGTRVLWEALRRSAEPGEEAALAELGGHLFAAQERVISAVTETYLDEQAALAAERREERRSLARALLDGRPVPQRWQGPALVVCVQLPPAADAAGERARHALVGARRVVRRLQAALERLCGVDVLTLLDEDGGHVIVPGLAAVPGDLMTVLRGAAGSRVRAAVAVTDGAEDIPGAAGLTSDVVRVARACGRPAGLHDLDDVLLEYHLVCRSSQSSERIRALLEPMADRPELLETLRVHLEQHQDRRATAALLHLHPNSVDNRINRIVALTGLDLSSPRDSALALASLLLRNAR
ncbi:PucR family transcriptional regulator [Streptomyces sediminimaris]|uniref:PucR family transcriptional regulator n=1 Tax=Streptomyces sediminimaris TaxID=3383721 RepID=UPI00399C420F